MPRSLGDVLSIFFFLAFMMLGSVAYLVARVRVRVRGRLRLRLRGRGKGGGVRLRVEHTAAR